MRKQEFRYATLISDDDSEILYATYTPSLEITIEVAHELVENRITFCNNRPHFILIDFTNVRSVTKEARDYMNSTEGGLKRILGGAFLSNNVVATLFINLYLKISNPVIPAKFFTSKAEAVKWLSKIKAERASVHSTFTL